MLSMIFNLINSVIDLFKDKSDANIARINQLSAQSQHAISIAWLSLFEFVLALTVIWNGFIVPNTGFPPIHTAFNVYDTFFQLIGVTGVKAVLKHIAKPGREG